MSEDAIKILLVDDDEDAYVLTGDLLEESGSTNYQIDWLPTYEQAVEVICRNEHDVYLLDYRLGSHNGIELLNKVHNWCPDKVAILLTGCGDHEVDLAAMKAGAADYWIKDQISGTFFERSIRYAIERKRAERLERERNNLQLAARSMEQVLGVVGHELRTPLASMRAMSEYLLTDGSQDTPDFNQFLQAINPETVRMAEMVNHMLEAARMESGMAKWNWSRVNLKTVCEDALEVVCNLVNTQEVMLSAQVAPDELGMNGDADAVLRLLINLLTNAHKHTDQGEIRVSASAASEDENEYVQLEVHDTGSGIPPEVAEKLGTPFALNAGSVGATYVKGSGLGLSICRGIVAVHGGRISVDSSPDRGTTITVRMRSDLIGPLELTQEVQIEQEYSHEYHLDCR